MNSRYVRYLAIGAWVAWGMVSVVAQAQLVDLGVATGYAINNAGQVVLSTGIYSNGTITPLPALPGQTTPAVGAAINATGQVAATSTIPSFSAPCPVSYTSPVVFSGGGLTNLFGPGTAGYATGINSSGEIVGVIQSCWDQGPTNSFATQNLGFIYANGTISSLSGDGFPPNTNNPGGINDSGQITGTVSTISDYTSQNIYVAYITGPANAGTTDLLGQGAGYAINNKGQATGRLDVSGFASEANYTILSSYAFLYSNGTTTKLGTLPGANDGTGYAINSTGQVVGTSGGHAFFYNGTMIDLNTLITATDPLKPYVTLQDAVGINDSLLILANGVDSRAPNEPHAYLYQASFIAFVPVALNFDTEGVGETTQTQSVTVTNAGTTPIPFGTPYVDGDFSLRTDSCGTSLAPGAECRIGVVFVPLVVGALSGVLTVPSGGVNYQVPLSGVGTITAKISASGGMATVGQPITLTWAASAGSTCAAASSSTNTAWTASNPPFTGTVPVSGKQTLTEIVNGTVTYTLNCTAPGVAAASVSASVAWSWPTVTAALSASPTTIIAGKSTTLTWKSSNATSCTAMGGGPDDSWAGTKATSGSQTITEPFALEVSSVVLTFAITCNSTTSGLSDAASVNVTEDQAPGGSGGDGVTATISASPTTITVGQSTTLTWKSSNATSCTATGGGADDHWAGSKATSGSQTVTEASALDTSSVVLTFWITCNSTTSGLSDKASVSVTENQAAATPPPAGSGGGGGALDPLSLAFLAGIFALRRIRVRIARP
jgi:probable HAF family extracellular repeat protein